MQRPIIQYSIILAYFVFIVVKGVRHSKDITDSDDFLVAGRNIGWFFLLCTMSATVIGGGIVILYSTAGGLLAVIHTDVYQLVILMAGFIFTLALCVPDIVTHTGQVGSIVPPEFFRLEGGKGWLFLVTTFLAFLLGETFAPGYATRYCVGRNIRETKRGIVGAGVLLAFSFPVILFFIALYARIHFPDID